MYVKLFDVKYDLIVLHIYKEVNFSTADARALSLALPRRERALLLARCHTHYIQTIIICFLRCVAIKIAVFEERHVCRLTTESV